MFVRRRFVLGSWDDDSRIFNKCNCRDCETGSRCEGVQQGRGEEVEGMCAHTCSATELTEDYAGYPAAHSVQPLFERLANNLAGIFACGWQPPEMWKDPVCWRRRTRNIVADHVVNCSMDAQRSLEKQYGWPFEDCNLSACNILIHSDGGTRLNCCSSFGWILEVCRLIDGIWEFKPLMMRGTYLSEPISSFLAETLALEEASLFVVKLLRELKHSEM